MVDVDEKEENEADQLKRKRHDEELNENAQIAKEAKERERKEKEAHNTLESRKTLFLWWTLERMLHEAVEFPSAH